MITALSAHLSQVERSGGDNGESEEEDGQTEGAEEATEGGGGGWQGGEGGGGGRRRGWGWRHEAKRITEVVKPFNSAGVRIREWGEVQGGLTKRLSRGGSFNRIQDGDAIGFRGRTRVRRHLSSGRIPGRPSFGFAPKTGHGVGYMQPGTKSIEEVQENGPDRQNP
jgi:hypothetical protein